jgi:D-sedoheptulose 7-phosphate isomerase
MQDYYKLYLTRLHSALEHVQFTEGSETFIEPLAGFERWIAMTEQIAAQKKSIYFIGNGTSAAIASYMAADACKNGKLRARALIDPSLTTAISNDLAYLDVFSLQIERYGDEGDLLISLSSSGNSVNILNAIDAARARKMDVITMSGMNPENKSRFKGDLNVFVPGNHYSIVQSAHQAILHCWLEKYLQVM